MQLFCCSTPCENFQLIPYLEFPNHVPQSLGPTLSVPRMLSPLSGWCTHGVDSRFARGGPMWKGWQVAAESSQNCAVETKAIELHDGRRPRPTMSPTPHPLRWLNTKTHREWGSSWKAAWKPRPTCHVVRHCLRPGNVDGQTCAVVWRIIRSAVTPWSEPNDVRQKGERRYR